MSTIFIGSLLAAEKNAIVEQVPLAASGGRKSLAVGQERNPVPPACRAAQRKQSGERRTGRSQNVIVSVGVGNRGGMNEAAFETALDGDGFGWRDEGASLAFRAGFDERATAAVLNDELVAEDCGDLAFHGGRAPIPHRRDGGWGGRHENRLTLQHGRGRDAGPQRQGDDRGEDYHRERAVSPCRSERFPPISARG